MNAKRIVCGTLAAMSVAFCFTGCGDEEKSSAPSKKKIKEKTMYSDTAAVSLYKAANSGLTEIDEKYYETVKWSGEGWVDVQKEEIVGGELFETIYSEDGVDYNYLTNFYRDVDKLDEAYILCDDYCCLGAVVCKDGYWGAYPPGLIQPEDVQDDKVDREFAMKAVEKAVEKNS